MNLYRGYFLVRTAYAHLFSQTPHYTCLARFFKNAHAVRALLAQRLIQAQPLLHVVNLKCLSLAHGHRIHSLKLPEGAVGVGPWAPLLG
ncbi:MAG: hypothetical protein KatS3mg070_2260 [Meiothermus sp.]|uniref:hypothetical protein n=1 Tax=Meiothermus sp. TaxID=1955249 RepID=UPI0021DB8044|nr:hypothetical protein [Meiothermus sp.]GIW28897.1 MAG: hypothetical protein KatS3mg070_2260 [Meiothermus sp.]